MKRILRSLLLVGLGSACLLSPLGCAGSRPAFEAPPGPGDPLLSSRAAVAEENYQRAVLRLNNFLRENPGSALLDEANFLLGRAYLGIKDRVQAADYFQRVLRDFQGSRFCPDAAWYLAVSYDGLAKGSQLDQDWTERAMSAYGTFLVQYPDHARVPEARIRIHALDDRVAMKSIEAAELYERLHAWESARIYYQKVIDEHPLSGHLCRARIGLGSCYLRLRQYEEAVTVLEAAQPECGGGSNSGDARKISDFLTRAREGAARAPAPRADVPADSLGTPPDSASSH